MADPRETLAIIRTARDQLAERLEANPPAGGHTTRTLLDLADKACSRLSNKLDVAESFTSFTAIPEAVIRAKQPAVEQVAFAGHLLDILAGLVEGTPVRDRGFVNPYVGNILAHTPSVPEQLGFAKLHNRNCNFNLIVSQISRSTQFTSEWVKFLSIGGWGNLWVAALEADLGSVAALRISSHTVLLAALCEKAYHDSRNDVHWPWELLGDEAIACLIMHAATPDVCTGAMTMLFYVGACAPAEAVNGRPPTREEYVHIRSIDGSTETLRADLHLLGGDRGHDDAAVAGILHNDLFDTVFDSLQFRRCNYVLDAYGRGVHTAGVDAGVALRGVMVRALNSGRYHLAVAELLVWAVHQLNPRYAIYEVWQRVGFRYTCDCYGTEHLGDSGGMGLHSSPGFASVLESHGLTGSVSDVNEAWVSYYRLLDDIWAGKPVDDWALSARPLWEYYAWCVADGSDAVSYGRLADLTVGSFITGRDADGIPSGRTECRRCARHVAESASARQPVA